MNQRVEKAIASFDQGNNCSISVFSGFWDLYGLTDVQGRRCACGFGGGVGGRRELCGAVSGMVLAGSLAMEDITNLEEKQQVMDTVSAMLAAFEAEYGTVVCTPLRDAAKACPIEGERECTRYVRSCAQIIVDTFGL
ncbi:C-GCAxxG-C-C family protein [Eubacteriales bacterium OttesenSCG-928-M02]|nr:C-GCAxxG-C-C family protein [Eubacteriales bacterium OttesenSCG-928-M02]